MKTKDNKKRNYKHQNHCHAFKRPYPPALPWLFSEAAPMYYRTRPLTVFDRLGNNNPGKWSWTKQDQKKMRKKTQKLLNSAAYHDKMEKVNKKVNYLESIGNQEPGDQEIQNTLDHLEGGYRSRFSLIPRWAKNQLRFLLKKRGPTRKDFLIYKQSLVLLQLQKENSKEQKHQARKKLDEAANRHMMGEGSGTAPTQNQTLPPTQPPTQNQTLPPTQPPAQSQTPPLSPQISTSNSTAAMEEITTKVMEMEINPDQPVTEIEMETNTDQLVMETNQMMDNMTLNPTEMLETVEFNDPLNNGETAQLLININPDTFLENLGDFI